MSWVLLQIAQHPKVQPRLQAEIRGMEAATRARGDAQFTMADFDAMPKYTTTVIKVCGKPSYVASYLLCVLSTRKDSADHLLITSLSGMRWTYGTTW